MAGACLGEATILGLVEGSLNTASARAAEAHVARCAECRQLVSALAKSSLVGGPREPALAPTELDSANRPNGGAPKREPTAPVRPGEVLAGKYRVDRVIGAGGMGIVVAATHVTLGQGVAIKFLLNEACEAPGAVARFLREAQAAVQIQGEHVARVTDVGTLDGTGAPYMVMELLRGADLAEIVRTRGRLAPETAAEYVLQACEAIAEAHALGIVHRDLKPANLFLASRPDGSPLVKVLDFGISKQIAVPSGLTSGEVMMGSPRYMSPEQMRSTRDVDVRTDIWALGTILFELVAGRAVFESDTMAGLCAAIQTDPAPPLRSVRPDAPELLERVVARCLEKDPARRMANVAELAHALAPIAPQSALVHVERIARLVGRAPRGAQSVPPSGPTPDAPPPGVATAGSFGSTTPTSRALPVGLFSALVVLLAIGATAAAIAPRHRADAAGAGRASAPAAEPTSPVPQAPLAAAIVSSSPAASATPPVLAPPAPSTAPSPPVAVRPPSTVRPAPHRVPPSVAPPAPAAASAAPSAARAPAEGSDVDRRGLLDRK